MRCSLLVHLMVADFYHIQGCTGSQINNTAGFWIYFRYIKVSVSDSAIAVRCTRACDISLWRRNFFFAFIYFSVNGRRSACRLLYLLHSFFLFFFYFALVFGFGGLSQRTANKSNSFFFSSPPPPLRKHCVCMAYELVYISNTSMCTVQCICVNMYALFAYFDFGSNASLRFFLRKMIVFFFRPRG